MLANVQWWANESTSQMISVPVSGPAEVVKPDEATVIVSQATSIHTEWEVVSKKNPVFLQIKLHASGKNVNANCILLSYCKMLLSTRYKNK